MLSPSDYLEQNAVSLSRGLREKEYTVEDLTISAISRAEAINPIINAIVTENYEKALTQAKYIDKNPKLLEASALAGFPFLIKDLSTVKGLPATFGSRLFKEHIAKKSSRIVESYLKAGLNIFGLTNTPEFGLTLTTEPVANGVTKNPWNTAYSTGGSSGGAAAAVAAGILPVAHATDGGGSIRIPASCCGLFGLKPSRGLTCIENDLTGSWAGMSVGHVVSQTVQDSAAFLDLITLKNAHLFPIPKNTGPFLSQIEAGSARLKIGLQLKHPFDLPIDPDCLEALDLSAKQCETLGHTVEEISTPLEYEPVVSAMSKLINTFIYRRVNNRLSELNLNLEDAQVENSTRIMAKLGSRVTAEDFIAAKDQIFNAELKLREFHKSYDLILSPVLAKTPAKLGWLDMNSDDMKNYTNSFRTYSGFTSIYNGTGQPSMSVPMKHSSKGLPIGVMFTGKWGSDLTLLQLAHELEQVNPWQRFTTPS